MPPVWHRWLYSGDQLLCGYQAYQPVTAPAGALMWTRAKTNITSTLTGGTAPGTQLDRQLQDALEKYERDKRARPPA